MANARKDDVAPGTPPQEDPKAVKAAAEEQQVHEEAAEKRTQGPFSNFDNVDDAVKDLEEKRQRLTEATLEASVAEQALPELKIAIQQAKVDELKQQEPQYADDGRLLGAPVGEIELEDEPVKPVALPRMYGGNPDPKTLRGVH